MHTHDTEEKRLGKNLSWTKEYNFHPMELAAAGGFLEVMKWLKRAGCPWSLEATCEAAKGGHLNVLEWIRKSKLEWHEETCEAAAGSGQLEVLQWLRETNVVEWDPSSIKEAAQGDKVITWCETWC